MELNRLLRAIGVSGTRILPRAASIAVLAILSLPIALLAHAHLKRSDPGAHARLATAPKSLRLWFSERPELAFTRIRLRGADSADVTLGAPQRMTDDDMGIAVPIPTALGAGTYTVLWRTAAADGHATTGSFTFDVVSGTVATATTGDTLRPVHGHSLVHVDTTTVVAPSLKASAATRWLEFMATLAAVGAVVFRLFVLRLTGSAPSLALPREALADLSDSSRRLATSALVLLLVAALSRFYTQGSAALGPDRPFDRGAVMTVLSSSWGRGWSIGVIGVLVAALGFAIVRYARAEAGWFVAALGALAIVIAPALTGHASATPPVGLARTADILHVLAASAWLGALLSLLFAALPLVRGTRAQSTIGSGALVASLVRSFHPVALTCAATVVVSGLVATWLRLPTVASLWESTYGRVLLLKLLFVAGVLVMGALNWRRMLPSLGDEAAARRITRTVSTELTIAALVLAVTAVLVSTPTP